jgi:type II secretory pathway component GspD/PulD (secretin)
MVKIFKANKLSYEFDRDANIFVVKDIGAVDARDLITRVFNLKYATVSTSSLREEQAAEVSGSAGAASKEGLSSSGGSSGGGKTGGKWEADKSAGITIAVRQLLSKESDGKEIGFVIEDFRTNSLIVTDMASNMPKIAALIATLDRPAAQVILEVEMLDVSKNVVDKLGVDWTNAGAFGMGIIPATHVSKFPFGSLAETFTGKSGVTTNDDVGVLSFNSLSLILDFLRTQTDTKYLARPRILTLNNETAEIKISTNEVIGETVTFSDTGAVNSRTAERTETGVMLRVTPQIDVEQGEILMFLTPKVIEAAESAFNGLGGASYRDPETRGTKSLVRVKDGETVVLGGLIRNQMAITETKLPFLSDIPVMGGLFRHKNKSRDVERELLIFITPKIVRDYAEQDLVRLSQPQDLPEREQGISTLGSSRQVVVNSSLNRFDSASK